ncbi:MAG: class I adenylate-forming enzyme family protein [Flavobacterium sp.]|uniref:class I adenylate-forming enzyme family protein n=1 Tax=Flavobacterium sp. TaxID=239 RepID=UPI003BD24B1D
MSLLQSVEYKVFHWAKTTPEKIAIYNRDERISYSQLASCIQNVSNSLLAKHSLKKGDIVFLIADKTPTFIYNYFALHLSGAIAVMIDPEITAQRFEMIKSRTRPRFIFGNPTKAIPREYVTEMTSTENSKVNVSFDEVVFPDLQDKADILFTTGTTGISKGVYLTNGNIAAAVRNINSFIKNSETDIELLALPTSHSFGLGRIRCVLSAGGAIVLINGFTNIKGFFRLIEEFHVTGLAFVPSAWAYIKKMSANRISDFAHQLKYIEIGSEYLSVSDKKQLIELLPHTRICMHYGLTEASRSVFLNFKNDYLNLDTLGKASPNVEVEVVGESGESLGENCEGEICIKGDHVARLYVGLSEEEVKDFFWKDYIRTGDYGVKLQNGYLKIVGRKKEIINVGGKKVSPIEIEEILNTINGISASACVGIPDPNGILGEVVKAFMVGDSLLCDMTEVKNKITTSLESYKWPFEYVWIDALPRTESGKIKRLELKNK